MPTTGRQSGQTSGGVNDDFVFFLGGGLGFPLFGVGVACHAAKSVSRAFRALSARGTALFYLPIAPATDSVAENSLHTRMALVVALTKAFTAQPPLRQAARHTTRCVGRVSLATSCCLV